MPFIGITGHRSKQCSAFCSWMVLPSDHWTTTSSMLQLLIHCHQPPHGTTVWRCPTRTWSSGWCVHYWLSVNGKNCNSIM